MVGNGLEAITEVAVGQESVDHGDRVRTVGGVQSVEQHAEVKRKRSGEQLIWMLGIRRGDGVVARLHVRVRQRGKVLHSLLR